MKFILTILITTSSVWALDYDPQFHLKHRYNRHQEIQQKMESSKKPLKPTPNVRMIDHKKQE